MKNNDQITNQTNISTCQSLFLSVALEWHLFLVSLLPRNSAPICPYPRRARRSKRSQMEYFALEAF